MDVGDLSAPASPGKEAEILPATSTIVLTGQGYWCRELAHGLSKYAGLSVGVAGLDSARDAIRLKPWRSIADACVVVIVGFRPGARTLRGVLFDIMFSLFGSSRNKRTVRYWIGTDVQRTLADHASGELTSFFERSCRSAIHLAGSSVLADDLEKVGVHAEVYDFPSDAIPTVGELPPMPERFRVLSYVPDGRFAFYGGPTLLDAARALPEVEFMIVGGTGSWAVDTPANVRFLGWQKDMRQRYADAACVVRLVEYDSFGGTVLEGLAYGRTVVYSRSLPHTVQVEFGDAAELAKVLRDLAGQYDPKFAKPDEEAASWVRDFVDPSRLFGVLAEKLRQLASGCLGSEAAATGGRD